ncbi:hypothetical protein, conserved [Babesia ovata]|uniref:Uncharacterized protein n=1 Tax=Babesia ovata TaxID=189622 RepID=A0A2H6K868_9APIC|nr:uncharacterized protein BOVATA_006860 [Babesia ovata]GBE59193.1 hypothetical protein, conserved [Babesia ovata]
MVYNSLTEAPHNLKEAIDWLMALRGTDAEKSLAAMGDALYKFLADKPVGKMKVSALENVKKISKKFMGQKALKDQPFVKTLLGRFKRNTSKTVSLFHRWFETMAQSDCENVMEVRGVKPEDITVNLAKAVDGCEKFLDDIKIPNQYKSAYSSGATWSSSCARNPEACAVVLVGIAPMLYAGLRSLKETSAEAANRNWLASYAELKLGKVLTAVGYKEPQCRAKMSGSDVFKALQSVSFEMLNTIYDLAGFWAFYGFDKVGDLKIKQSVEPERPAEPVRPADPEGPVEPVGPGKRERPEKRGKGFEDERFEGEEPEDSVEPVEPVQSAEGEEAEQSVEPVEPVQSAEGEEAEQSVEPVEPVKEE